MVTEVTAELKLNARTKLIEFTIQDEMDKITMYIPLDKAEILLRELENTVTALKAIS